MVGSITRCPAVIIAPPDMAPAQTGGRNAANGRYIVALISRIERQECPR
jgi:hypothetical protein